MENATFKAAEVTPGVGVKLKVVSVILGLKPLARKSSDIVAASKLVHYPGGWI
jgi:hypothetical protein